ncbi:BZ3500_MvSof-1268-A1-R1_Chr11-2g03450 [Microbotryum saponariae]|uniref:BZ3500_MvSof-1268-A1-R1_Chr11-2g03450 protein n=1 Tax=Microbotryum saponariae TaxID=289078 RepID=A0A2X0LEB1_9BASI|nr:BZ3500_MvSof-1268-A1-R1_Chr11-2g03450 [Microbotryum saponariae]SDA03400.1 BZ3501_MvSof-1269-A2-R1_Chr11g03021 [Microbotryum saponariae]
MVRAHRVSGAHHRRSNTPTKAVNSNWSSLKRVLELILRLAREDGAQSRSRINDWIAEQVDNTSEPSPPSSLAMTWLPKSSPPITDALLDAIAENNPFISGRIRILLSQCGDSPPAERINCDNLKAPTASTDVEME